MSRDEALSQIQILADRGQDQNSEYYQLYQLEPGGNYQKEFQSAKFLMDLQDILKEVD